MRVLHSEHIWEEGRTLVRKNGSINNNGSINKSLRVMIFITLSDLVVHIE